jgi:hypothetical protein
MHLQLLSWARLPPCSLKIFQPLCIYQGNKVDFIDKLTVKKRESMV